MCWRIDKKEFESNCMKYHKVAQEDITVYKIGYSNISDRKFLPYFHNDEFSYDANKPNRRLYLHKYEQWCDFTIDEGYHSFSEDCYCKLEENFTSINREFNVYTINTNGWRLLNSFFDCIHNNVSIGKFIIPKDTEYYENEKGFIVSSQIIWTGNEISLMDDKLLNADKPFKFKELCVGQ